MKSSLMFLIMILQGCSSTALNTPSLSFSKNFENNKEYYEHIKAINGEQSKPMLTLKVDQVTASNLEVSLRIPQTPVVGNREPNGYDASIRITEAITSMLPYAAIYGAVKESD